ncbi:MAG: hypothetical protein Q9M75_03550 [Ghiorsea sp.]|nr:hypothetical protein [Ghiorsea sp.]
MMSNTKQDKDTERFYNISYFIVPIPMVLGLIFAVYVLATEDSRNLSYCITAKSIAAYQQTPLNEKDFTHLEAVTLDICKNHDDDVDDGGGRGAGKVSSINLRPQ